MSEQLTGRTRTPINRLLERVRQVQRRETTPQEQAEPRFERMVGEAALALDALSVQAREADQGPFHEAD